jgi:hypothetical protein
MMEEGTMTTLDQTRTDSTPQRAHGRRWVVTALIAVLALLVGGAVGWMAHGDAATASMVSAGETELTPRQEQMAAFMDDYREAWRAGDGAAVTAMYVPEGTFNGLGTTHRVDDGTLAGFVQLGGWDGLTELHPGLARGSVVLNFHSLDADTYQNVLTFTESGELLLVDHTITQ